MIPEPELSYEERRQELALLERLTAHARLQLAREGSRVRPASVQASAEGVLVSEILGIFLFLFLVGGLLLFFQKETGFGAEWRRRLGRAAHRLAGPLRRRLVRSDHQWNCRQEASEPTDTPGPGVYRSVPEEAAGVQYSTPSKAFNHRQALLELFADLEPHHEAVRHSLRGYASPLPRLGGPSDSTQMSPPPRSHSVKVAPLPGILRTPAAARSNPGPHRHRRLHWTTGAEEHSHRTDGRNSDVSDLAQQPGGDDVTVQVDSGAKSDGAGLKVCDVFPSGDNLNNEGDHAPKETAGRIVAEQNCAHCIEFVTAV